MLHAVSRAISQLFQSGVPFYRAGVGCLELIDSQFLQHDLFEPSYDNTALMNCMDAIRRQLTWHHRDNNKAYQHRPRQHPLMPSMIYKVLIGALMRF